MKTSLNLETSVKLLETVFGLSLKSDQSVTHVLAETIADRVKKALPIDKLYTPEELCAIVGANAHPEEVFTEDQLTAWATENGYVRSKT